MPISPVVARAALVGLLLAALAPALVAESTEPMQLSQRFPTGEARWVTLDVGVADLKVEASDDPEVQVDLTIECTAEAADCQKVAQKLKIDSRRRGEKLAISLKGPSGTRSGAIRVHGTVLAPRRLPLSIDMGVGDLVVSGFQHDLYVDLNVGNVQARLPQRAVRSVGVKANVGDAALTLPSGRMEGTGFVGKGLRWTSGQGSSAIEIQVNVGNVELQLD